MFFHDSEARELTPVIPSAPAPLPMGEEGPKPDEALFKDWQRTALEARLMILQHIKQRTIFVGSVNKAVSQFIAACKMNSLQDDLKELVLLANKRSGKGKRAVSKGTIYRWLATQEENGDNALAPADSEKRAVPCWLAEFLSYYRRPQKPSIPQALEWMREAREQEGRSTGDVPSYSQVNRFMKKFSFLDQNRGRMTGSELRAIRAYTVRDFSDLEPMDIIVADGHSWKSKIAHPIHGRPFNPEVEGIIDVATRVLVGWSAWLAESAQIVADALRYAITVTDDKPYGGIPAIFYSDHGAGNKAKRIAGPITGILARMHITPMRSIPGNPQSRGVIERMQSSVWIRAAKEHESFSGKSMDSLALIRVTKIIEQDLKAGRMTPHLMSWPQFLEFLDYHANAYNNRPHSALPKITDPRTGLRRHMTPMERWNQFTSKGWKPELATQEELDGLFRPQEIVTTKNAMVRVLGNAYFSKALEHYHGDQVIAEYDVHDATRVRVRNMEGQFICLAEFEGNKRRWIPKSLKEITQERRTKGRLKLKMQQIEEIKLEAMGLTESEVGTQDFSMILPEGDKPAPIFAYETDREIWEEEHGKEKD